jgi:hypothetical protein
MTRFLLVIALLMAGAFIALMVSNLAGCGPVPYKPCTVTQENHKGCDGAEVMFCNGEHWAPTGLVCDQLSGPDGQTVVKQCVTEGTDARCQ